MPMTGSGLTERTPSRKDILITYFTNRFSDDSSGIVQNLKFAATCWTENNLNTGKIRCLVNLECNSFSQSRVRA
jgi:hypothetical protein